MARALVIDDDDPMRTLMRRMLERAGHEVTEARDGVEAVRLFETRRVDLVVVDLYLPHQDGWATIRALHRIVPDLPFIVVSGGGALELVRRGSRGTLAAARGAAQFRVLRKPFRRDALAAAARERLPGAPTGAVHAESAS